MRHIIMVSSSPNLVKSRWHVGSTTFVYKPNPMNGVSPNGYAFVFDLSLDPQYSPKIN